MVTVTEALLDLLGHLVRGSLLTTAAALIGAATSWHCS
jgi:hypothetical protein